MNTGATSNKKYIIAIAVIAIISILVFLFFQGYIPGTAPRICRQWLNFSKEIINDSDKNCSNEYIKENKPDDELPDSTVDTYGVCKDASFSYDLTKKSCCNVIDVKNKKIVDDTDCSPGDIDLIDAPEFCNFSHHDDFKKKCTTTIPKVDCDTYETDLAKLKENGSICDQDMGNINKACLMKDTDTLQELAECQIQDLSEDFMAIINQYLGQ